jgi:hypothetical protein
MAAVAAVTVVAAEAVTAAAVVAVTASKIRLYTNRVGDFSPTRFYL